MSWGDSLKSMRCPSLRKGSGPASTRSELRVGVTLKGPSADYMNPGILLITSDSGTLDLLGFLVRPSKEKHVLPLVNDLPFWGNYNDQSLAPSTSILSQLRHQGSHIVLRRVLAWQAFERCGSCFGLNQQTSSSTEHRHSPSQAARGRVSMQQVYIYIHIIYIYIHICTDVSKNTFLLLRVYICTSIHLCKIHPYIYTDAFRTPRKRPCQQREG